MSYCCRKMSVVAVQRLEMGVTLHQRLMTLRIRLPGLPDFRLMTNAGQRFARRRAGQTRRSERAAGFPAFMRHHRHRRDIRQQLRPERTAGAAANQ